MPVEKNIKNDYNNNGFVCLEGKLPKDLVKLIDSIVANNDYGNTFATAGCKENIIMSVEKNGNDVNSIIMRIVTHPFILDFVQEIVGPNILLFGITKFFKQGIEKDFIIPWHQDGFFYPIKPLEAITLTIP